jgi:hypothetical protein
MTRLNHRKKYLIGLLILASGIIINTQSSDAFMNLGSVFIAIGCLFLISGAANKKRN